MINLSAKLRIPIAIFDRNPDFLRLLTYVLRQRNSEEIDILVASDNINALLGQTNHVPRVVIIGLSVPNLVDAHMIEHLRMHWPHACVLALSWFEQEEYYSQALASGADGVISKLQLAKELLEAIRKLCNTPIRKHEDEHIRLDQV